MALRDQPYIPLYIQDLMTDEKLNNCCASTHGIYIKGIMCLMHKSEDYGKILLQQKFKQTDKQSKNFAIMLVKHLPYTIEEIEKAIDELIEEKVCYFEDDFICQKRMIKDGAISKIRSKVGGKGGKKTKENRDNLINDLVQQKEQQIVKQNTEYEIESEGDNANSSFNNSNNNNAEISKKIDVPCYSDLQKECKEKIERYESTFLIEDLQNFVDHFKSVNIKEHEIKDAMKDFKLNKINNDTPVAPYTYKNYKEWFKKYITDNRAKYIHVPKFRVTFIDESVPRLELHAAFKFYWQEEYTIEYIREKIFSGEFQPQYNLNFDKLVNNKLIVVEND